MIAPGLVPEESDNMKPLIVLLLALAAGSVVLSFTGCVLVSLGSAPASERTLKCHSHETLVCRSRSPTGRIGTNDEDREYDMCTCESLNDGLPL